jgi:hypothetical protein
MWKQSYEPRVEVNEDGECRYADTGLIIPQTIHKTSLYSYIHVFCKGRKRPEKRTNIFPVHRLIAQAFLGNPPFGKPNVNHKDFDRQNNSPSNLEWCSQKENCRHTNHADRRHRALDIAKVQAIRKMRQENPGWGPTRISRALSLSEDAINCVLYRGSWSWVS